jgi:hypothetical protein
MPRRTLRTAPCLLPLAAREESEGGSTYSSDPDEGLDCRRRGKRWPEDWDEASSGSDEECDFDRLAEAHSTLRAFTQFQSRLLHSFLLTTGKKVSGQTNTAPRARVKIRQQLMCCALYVFVPQRTSPYSAVRVKVREKAPSDTLMPPPILPAEAQWYIQIVPQWGRPPLTPLEMLTASAVMDRFLALTADSATPFHPCDSRHDVMWTACASQDDVVQTVFKALSKARKEIRAEMPDLPRFTAVDLVLLRCSDVEPMEAAAAASSPAAAAASSSESAAAATSSSPSARGAKRKKAADGASEGN